jgi:hypothetical protein
MTPSGWHDDARNRDAGHDEMQIAVFDYLKDRLHLRGKDDYEHRIGLYFESPFYVRGHIVAWGDIVELWEKPQYETSKKRKYIVWEIKPKIYSVGAVIRQCRSLADAVEAANRDSVSHRRAPSGIYYDDPMVLPIVRSDDPKLSMLRHVWHAVAWDGEHLS